MNRNYKACSLLRQVVVATLTIVTLGAAATAYGKPAPKFDLPAADKKFAVKVAQGGKAEVDLSQLAVNKGSSDSVKQFAQRMVDDHNKANAELKSLAQSKGVTLPGETDPAHKAFYSKLSARTGAAFDMIYIDAMLKDHKTTVAAFEKEAKNAKDADLKAWVVKTLPTLQEHLKMVTDIRSGMAGGKAKK